jgi:predicted regulator of Ras-like GTPase activity (Roadblock/LC7/MglB family)
MPQSPLLLTRADQDFITEVLVGLLRKSEAHCVLVVDQSGRCLARAGFTEKIDTDALAALVAGSFSSTRAMASLVGESEFSVLFHQGQHDHIHNILVDNDRILTVIFDRHTTVGMVRLYAKQAAKKIAERFAEITQRHPVPPDAEIHDALVEDTGKRLDQIFGP